MKTKRIESKSGGVGKILSFFKRNNFLGLNFYKNCQYLLMLVICVLNINALFAVDGDLPNLKEFTPLEATQKIILAESFEKETNTTYTYTPDIKWQAHEGDNGTGGLVFERKELSANHTYVSFPLKYTPGKKYKATISCKLERIAIPGNKLPSFQTSVICAEFHKNGKWLKGVYPHFTMTKPDRDWFQAEVEFTPPVEADACSILLILNEKCIGKVTFDNLLVEELGDRQALIYPIYPKNFVLNDDGKIRFSIFNYEDTDKLTLLLHISVGNTESVAPIKKRFAEFTLGKLPAGKYPLTARLLDMENKKIIGEKTFPFTKLSPDESMPPGAVSSGAEANLKIDGKNFLPIGIFTGRIVTPDDLKRIKEGGFNAIMPYASMKLRIDGNTGDFNIENLLKSMDMLHKYDLKLLFDIKEQIPGRNNIVREYDGVSGADEVTKHIIDKIKRHPALLGWYVSDENQISDIPKIIALRELISGSDPYHMTATLTNKPKDYPYFATSGDVLMANYYQILDEKNQDMKIIRTVFETAAMESRIGCWFVPQGFNWGAILLNQPYKSFRYPTEQEMRSMCLLAMNHGIKGYFFWWYDSIFAAQEKFDPGSSKFFWPNVCAVAKLLQRLSPFFFTQEKAPEISVKSTGESLVEAKSYKIGNDIIIVITGDGPKCAEAEITVKDAPELNSEYGLTVSKGKGVYLFTGTDICSDILSIKK